MTDIDDESDDPATGTDAGDDPATDDGPTKVAVACQGGGSHTAFTAGVLTRLLEEPDPDFEVVGLTGTSGGALCAFLAWYGLQTAGPERAVRLLADLWDDLAADDVGDATVNAAVVLAAGALQAGFPVPQASPAHVGADEVARDRIEAALTRHVDRARVAALVDRPDPPPPRVLVSAVDVDDGRFVTFGDRPDDEPAAAGRGRSGWNGDRTDVDRPDDGRGDATSVGDRAAGDRIAPPRRPVSVEAVLASGAVPTLYEAMAIPDADGREHAYWDGLFSQNPPVRNLLSGVGTAAEKPDEIWLVRINPERRPGRLAGLAEIADRRNELAGSLSLNQELHFVRTVNRWLEAGRFAEPFARELKPVTVRQVELDESRLDPPRRLLAATKVDRAPGFIDGLRALGETQAGEFLDDRDAHRHVVVEPGGKGRRGG